MARRLTANIDENADQSDGGVVRSVDRALRLLEILAVHARGLGLVELAAQARLPASTTHRLLTTLQQRGFVRFESRSGEWFVGRTALNVGVNYASSRDLVALSLPVLNRFSNSCGEIVNLGTVDSGNVVFLHRVDPRQRKSYVPAADKPIPLHCSSIGKMLLALMPARDQRDALPRKGLVPVTGKTVTSEPDLRCDLERANKNGFAFDDEENTPGLRCIAAPVFDEYARPIAAVSIAAPIDRLRNGQVADYAARVKAAAKELTTIWTGNPV